MNENVFRGFADEMNKEGSKLSLLIEKHPILAAGLLSGVGSAAATQLMIGKSGRKQISREIRDPRLYSNLRGGLTLESAEERVKAHKGLAKNKDGGVLSAMRKGFLRSKV